MDFDEKDKAGIDVNAELEKMPKAYVDGVIIGVLLGFVIETARRDEYVVSFRACRTQYTVTTQSISPAHSGTPRTAATQHLKTQTYPVLLTSEYSAKFEAEALQLG